MILLIRYAMPLTPPPRFSPLSSSSSPAYASLRLRHADFMLHARQPLATMLMPPLSLRGA